MGIPIVGTWMHWALFGGDFPGEILIPRLYALHILLIPGIILALIGVHLALVWFQKHTQFPGPGRTETNVVGVRVMPVFAVKSGAFFAVTVGVLGLMGGLLQINDLGAGSVQAVAGVGGQPAGLLHDVDRRVDPSVAGMGVLPLRPHHPAACGWRSAWAWCSCC